MNAYFQQEAIEKETFIPLVDSLVANTQAWKEEHEFTFACDSVSQLAMLDEYALLGYDREEEKRRMRDQKKLYTEQEAILGSRPSPARPLSSMKKVMGPRVNGGAANETPVLTDNCL